ncbi:MAG TPA: helix-turn-helix transcriptional regulator [Pseudolabrys sp.]|nr:helix-turn-helix transcriptional regulator [Pseudolabrys sp.]
MAAKPGKLRQVLARNIRNLRSKRGITQEELAHRARIHRTYMSSVERAQRNVSIDNIERIAAGLEVAPQDLLVDRR